MPRSLLAFGLTVSLAIGNAHHGRAQASDDFQASLRVLPTGGLRVEAAALLLSGQQGGPVPIAVWAAPLAGAPSASGKVAVLVIVEARGAVLVEGIPPLLSSPHRGGEGPIAGDLSSREEGEKNNTGDLSSRGSLEIPSQSLPSSPRAAWGRTEEGGASKERTGPARSGSSSPREAHLEVNRRTEEGGASLAIDIALYGLDAEGALAVSLLETIEILDGPALETVRAAGLRYSAVLTLPPGDFSLRVLFGDAKTQTVGLRTLALSIPAKARFESHAEGDPPPPLFPRTEARWLAVASRSAEALPQNPRFAAAAVRSVDLVASATGDDERADDDAKIGKARWRRAEVAALERSYLAALAPLAQGDLAAARAAVAAFEVPLLAGERAVAIGDLAKLEARALHKLVGRIANDDPEGLLLLIALYVGLHADYQDRGLRQPTMHAAILASGFADLFARQKARESAAAPSGHTVAAGLLVGLVPRLIQGGLVNFAEQLLVQARTLDPAHPLALLTAARMAERQAHTEAAAEALETLVALEPTNAEARLRLAIQRARLGKTAKAREILRTLVAPVSASNESSEPSEPKESTQAADAWIFTVAHQELARLDLRARDWKAATATIALGRARFPEDEKLALLQAMLADLQGDAETARGTLDSVSTAPAQLDSPRLTYAQVSLAKIADLTRSLEPLVQKRAPTFAAAWGKVVSRGKR